MTKSVKKDIDKYNNEDHGTIQQESLPITISFDEVKDPDCPFWYLLHGPNAGSNESQISIPLNMKRKAIDLCHLLDRAKEEQVLLKEEMRNIFHHYQRQHDLVTEFILATSNNPIVDERQAGELLFCRKKLLHVECRLCKVKETFSPHIDIELPRLLIMTGDQSENEDDEVGDDEETVIVHPLAEESESECEYESDEEFSIDDSFL